jgi:hypothetical protein
VHGGVGEDGISNRLTRLEIITLPQVTDSCATRNTYAPRNGGFRFRENPQQGAFTSTISPNNTDPITRINADAHLLQYWFVPIDVSYSLSVDQVFSD